ncbi:MAG: hypothetical protein JXX29_15185, partial [Deltaproteobacteria bacterium]|nr:hypothetical protein [Deltaproteobacteria bacterium]MBN2673025.1 hypothetical protein [Deltaproteobacteria bacterium]
VCSSALRCFQTTSVTYELAFGVGRYILTNSDGMWIVSMGDLGHYGGDEAVSYYFRQVVAPMGCVDFHRNGVDRGAAIFACLVQYSAES